MPLLHQIRTPAPASPTFDRQRKLRALDEIDRLPWSIQIHAIHPHLTAISID
jgi:hypothetical protein